MTPRQQAILDFLHTFVDEHGFPPSMVEIGEHVGLASTSSVAYQLRNLQDQGLILIHDRTMRGITILDRGES